MTPQNLSEQTLALPNGAGAVSSAGQTFQVSGNQGTGGYEIPIATPPGHAGLSPALALRYSTGGGAGLAGQGWSLSLATLSRRLDRGLPSYDDEADTFLLQGDELVPIGEGRYRFRIETRFARIDHVTEGDDDVWVVTEKDGTRVFYGESADATLQDEHGRIATWFPTRKQDVHGNVVTYTWTRDSDTRDARLTEVSWAGCYRVTLSYEARPDPVVSGRTGFLHTADQRLSAIALQVKKTSDNSWFTFRTYALAYETSSVTGRSLLSGVTLTCSAPGQSDRTLPGLSFTYTDGGFAARAWARLDAVHPGGALSDANLTLVRQSGSGLPDLLVAAPGGHWLWRNRGEGAFDPPVRVAAPIAVLLSQPGTFISDMDGDGWGDLVVGGGRAVYRGAPGGGWSEPLLRANSPTVNLNAPDVRVLDLDGDGIPDALRLGPHGATWYRNLGQGRWSSGVHLLNAPPVHLDDPRAHLVDLNGDGLPDLVLVHRGRVEVWPGLGGGRFGAPFTLDNAPDLGADYDPRRVRWADLSGSGQADLIYQERGRVTVYLNQGGVALADGVRVADTGLGSRGHVEPVDLLGNGASGLLFTDDGQQGAPWRYLDLFPDGAPDLIESIDNGIGATTTIAYGSSAAHCLRDRAAGAPWATFLPFVQRVVDAVTVEEENTGLVLGTEYRYHHGVYDGAEREFRGFGQVEQLEVETDPDAEDPLVSVLLRRWYHVGTDLDLSDEYHALDLDPLETVCSSRPSALRALRGLLLREEVYALDDETTPYAVSETGYQVYPLEKGEDGVWSDAPLPKTTRRTLTERSTEARVVETSTTYDLDDGAGYGLAVRIDEVGLARGTTDSTDLGDQQDTELHRYTTQTWHDAVDDDPASWSGTYTPYYLVGFVYETRRYAYVDGTSDTLLSQERRYYDGDDYEGLGYPGGTSTLGVTHGRLRCVLALALTDDLLSATFPTGAGAEDAADDRGHYLVDGTERWLHAERYAQTTEGLVSGFQDPNGNAHTFSYDTTWDLFPVEAVDAAGHPTALTRGELPFQVESVLDANGNTTTFGYDATGLPAWKAVQGKETSPGTWEGDDESYPTEEYEYDFTVQPLQVITRTRQVRHGATLDVYRYLDGLGRTLQERHTAEPESGSSTARYRVTGWVEYNHKGKPYRAFQPTFESASAFSEPSSTSDVYVQTTYDPLGRVVRVDHPDGTFETTSFHPWYQDGADRNDNAGDLDSSDTRYGDVLDRFEDHLDTPTRTYFDALGRTIGLREDTGTEQHTTRTVYDLADRVTEVWDARGLSAATWTFAYDVAGRRIRAEHSTALGERFALTDAAGNPIWSRDARGIEVDRTFDALNRPLSETTDDGTTEKLRRLWTYLAYNESDPDFSDYQEQNLFGRAEEERDADGVRSFTYDWRGKVLSTIFRFWRQKDGSSREWNNASHDMWTGDWDPAIDDTDRDSITEWLELPHAGSGGSTATSLLVETAYDAAGRPTTIDYPGDLQVQMDYGEGGHPSALRLSRDGGSSTEDIVVAATYNARGQLLTLELGNDLTTEREYDAAIERLTRIFTHGTVGGNTTHLQDLEYLYDPAGNPVVITDNLTTSTYKANQIIPNTRAFWYDGRYRLTRATGKKHATITDKTTGVVISSPDPNDYDPYDFDYAYDEVGNLTTNDEYRAGGTLYYKDDRIDLFNGDVDEAGSYTEPDEGNFTYDENGNARHTPRIEELAYTHDDQPRYVDLGTSGQIRYLRHGDQRVLRLASKPGVFELNVYLGPWEYHHRDQTSGYTKVVLGLEMHGRHAQAEAVLDGSDPDSLDLFYHHSDHLGSGHVLTHEDGTLLSQEEFFPYGRASDRRDARNRYRYIGVEMDADTGLCMTGPRTYDPVSGRFLQGDPLAANLVTSTPFGYAAANPILKMDPNGNISFLAALFGGCNGSQTQSSPPSTQTPAGEQPAEQGLAPDAPLADESLKGYSRKELTGGRFEVSTVADKDALALAAIVKGGVRPSSGADAGDTAIPMPKFLTDVTQALLHRTNDITQQETGGVYWVTADGRQGFTWGGDGWYDEVAGVHKTNAPTNARSAVPKDAIVKIAIHTHPAAGSDGSFPSQLSGDMSVFMNGGWDAYMVTSSHGGPLDAQGVMPPGSLLLAPTEATRRDMQAMFSRYAMSIGGPSPYKIITDKGAVVPDETLNSLALNGEAVGYRVYLGAFGGTFQRYPW